MHLKLAQLAVLLDFILIHVTNCVTHGYYDNVIRVEGDILVDRHTYLETRLNQHQQLPYKHRGKRAVTSIPEKLWSNATVPYKLGDNITAAVRANIMKAMSHWEKHTCLQFVKRTDQLDYILFASGRCGCCSFVGKVGGEQLVTLSPHCAVYGVVIHELGHVIGFWHEHSRPDRDEFIKIIRENVVLEKMDNFEKKTRLEIDSLGQPYDYGSVMHYRKKTFSRNRKNTMEPIALGVRIGQRERLSVGDIIQANLLYKCPKPDCTEELYDKEGNFSSPNYPVQYFRDHECTWILHVLPGEKVNLEFTVFNLEKSFNCSYDYVEIREGIDSSGPLVGRLCGEGEGGTVSALSSLWVKFFSDRSVTSKGFMAHYQKSLAMDIASGAGMAGSGEIADEASGEIELLYSHLNMYADRATYSAECNQYLIQDRGSIVTPLLPVGYVGKPVECSWTIQGGTNASRIYLLALVNRHLPLQSHCMGDIYRQLEKPLKSHGRKKLDNEINPDKQHQNYTVERAVEYNCSEARDVLLDTKSVTIHWSADQHMELTLKYIIDYDECALGLSRCDQGCNNTIQGYKCFCHRGYMLDGSGHYCKPKLVQFKDRCNTNLTQERGRLRAGTEPYEDCFIHIVPPDGGRIVLLFHKFSVPSNSNGTNGTCNGSYVEVLAGVKMVPVSQFCGDTPPEPQTAAVALGLHIHTDIASLPYLPYFTAEYYVYKDQPSSDQQEGRCFHRLQSDDLITSPDFPMPYPASSLCVWRISAKTGQRIHFVLDEIDIEYTRNCGFDFLEVRDGKHRNSPLIGRYCGSNTNRSIVSTDRHLWIGLITDSTGSGRGFRGHFLSEVNGLT